MVDVDDSRQVGAKLKGCGRKSKLLESVLAHQRPRRAEVAESC